MANDIPIVLATDHQTDDGSVVHSGIEFADAIIDLLNTHSRIEASLSGLKGASSSYFNVFLRRIDEACGIQAFQENVSISFDSNVQKMMYERSLESMKRGVHRSASKDSHNDQNEIDVNDKKSFISKVLDFFGS